MSYAFQSPVVLHQKIHQRALDASAQYKKSEAELMEVLEQVETHKVYLHYGYASLFRYGLKELRLSENIIYNLITVMRKAKQLPQLKNEIREGRITLSNAKRIAPVLTLENQNEWIKKAGELTQRQLEKEIVKVRPLNAVQERASYVTPQRVKLEVGLFEKEMLKLRRVQDLLSQSRSNHSTLEEALIEMMDFYLQHRDPLLKAKRVTVKKGTSPVSSSALVSRPVSATTLKNITTKTPKRAPIPAAILHQVNLRDQRQCTFINGQNQERCSQRRWIEIHHRIPVSQGGENTLQNLTTLCSAHHQWVHLHSQMLLCII